jgi:hypothetical protein
VNNLIIASSPEEAKKRAIALMDTTAVALKAAIMAAGSFTITDNPSDYEFRRSFRVRCEHKEPETADWQEVIRVNANEYFGHRWEIVVERPCVVGSRGRKRKYTNLSQPTWNKIAKDLHRAVKTTIDNYARRQASQATDAAWKAAANVAFKGTAIPPGVRITPVMDNELPPSNPDDMRFAISFEHYGPSVLQNAHLTAAETKKLTAVLIEVLHLDTAWIIVRPGSWLYWSGTQGHWNGSSRSVQTFPNKDLAENTIAEHKGISDWAGAKAVPYTCRFNEYH